MVKNEFVDIVKISVVIQERKVMLSTSPENWHTHAYRKMEDIPERLPPAYGGVMGVDDIELLNFIRKCYASRLTESILEQPYSFVDRQTQAPKSVLRTVTAKIRYASAEGATL